VYLDKFWWETYSQVTVTVTATNIFGEQTSKTHTTTIESEWVPEVNLPDEITENNAYELRMLPWIEWPDACTGQVIDYNTLTETITWSLADGEAFDAVTSDGLTQTKWATIQANMNTPDNRDFLVIPENTLLTSRSYTFEVSVATNINTKVAKAKMLVNVKAAPLEVWINGGYDSINVREQVTLDAGLWDPQDPNATAATATTGTTAATTSAYTYTWGCEDWTGFEDCPISYSSGIDASVFSPEAFEDEVNFVPGTCLDGLTPGQDLMTRLVNGTSVLSIGANGLVSGKLYVFTLNITKGTDAAVSGFDAACIEATSSTAGSVTVSKIVEATTTTSTTTAATSNK